MFYSQSVSAVDARCPMPKAPGTCLLKSVPATSAPVVEWAGRGRWMKFTTVDVSICNQHTNPELLQTAVVP
jgi:hypothetical protein